MMHLPSREASTSCLIVRGSSMNSEDKQATKMSDCTYNKTRAAAPCEVVRRLAQLEILSFFLMRANIQTRPMRGEQQGQQLHVSPPPCPCLDVLVLLLAQLPQFLLMLFLEISERLVKNRQLPDIVAVAACSERRLKEFMEGILIFELSIFPLVFPFLRSRENRRRGLAGHNITFRRSHKNIYICGFYEKWRPVFVIRRENIARGKGLTQFLIKI
eukprot:759529-Hanusia_phi.AAC.12